MVLIPLILIGVGVAFWYRRMHLMVNHPDRYERFHETEKKFAHVQVKATEGAARGLLAALRRVWEYIRGKLFKKREPPLLGDEQWNS